jgi:hypothetical protein
MVWVLGKRARGARSPPSRGKRKYHDAMEGPENILEWGKMWIRGDLVGKGTNDDLGELCSGVERVCCMVMWSVENIPVCWEGIDGAVRIGTVPYCVYF